MLTVSNRLVSDNVILYANFFRSNEMIYSKAGMAQFEMLKFLHVLRFSNRIKSTYNLEQNKPPNEVTLRDQSPS